MGSTTTRQVGYGGTAHIGSTSGASDVSNSGEIQEWSLDTTVETEDMRGLNDFDSVDMPTGRKATGTIKSMRVGSALSEALSAATSAGDFIMYLVLRVGSGFGATVGSGDIVREGWALITGANLNNPRGKVVEDVKFTFQGA